MRHLDTSRFGELGKQTFIYLFGQFVTFAGLMF